MPGDQDEEIRKLKEVGVGPQKEVGVGPQDLIENTSYNKKKANRIELVSSFSTPKRGF